MRFIEHYHGNDHMKAGFKRFIDDIKHGENVDLYITLVLSFILAILGIIGTIQITVLSAGILASLSILVYNMLTTRRSLDDFSHVITSLQPTDEIGLKDRISLAPLQERLEGRTSIWLFGVSLTNLWPPNNDLFIEKIKKGAEAQMLLLNPESASLPFIAELMAVRPGRLKIDILKTLDECTEFIQKGLGAGKFEIRLTEIDPGYSLVILDASKSNGHLMVEYLGYHSTLNGRPHINLDRTRNSHWFDYYLHQYQGLWNSATEFKTTKFLLSS